MNDVSVLVEHDVSIVSVLNLEKIADQAVGGHADDKISTRLQC